MGVKENWVFNRAGLVNYWWFDHLEIDFSEDGNVLIKGPNASGKSITLTALIPIIFDGVTQPERLDPFASREKKLRYYTLDGKKNIAGDQHCYIYVEFIKRETNEYFTAIIGFEDSIELKNRNRQPEKSFYVITDGRRVSKDIHLHSVSNDECTFTTNKALKSILKNTPDVNSITKYKEFMCHNLFGFETVEQYEQMISLMLLVRGVKLEKAKGDKTVLEKLSSSLNTISRKSVDAIARHYSELDEYLENLEITSRELEYATDILKNYKAYLNGLLIERINYYEISLKETKQVKKKIDSMKASISDKKIELTKITHAHDKLRKRYDEAVSFLETESNSELKELPFKIETAKKDKEVVLKRINGISEQIKRQKDKIIDLNEEIESLYLQVNEGEQKVVDLFQCICEENKSLKLPLLGLNDLHRNPSVNISKPLVVKELTEADEVISKARKIFDEVEKLNAQLEDKRVDLEKLLSNINDAEFEIDLTETKKGQLIGKLIGEIHEWHASNTVFTIERSEEFQSILSCAQSLDDQKGFIELETHLNHAYINVENRYERMRLKNAEELSEIDQCISDIELEIDKAKADKDVAYIRSEGMNFHRDKLVQSSIPHMSLYEAIRFKKGVSDKVQNAIEGALKEVGLLDALVLSNDDRKMLMAGDESFHDLFVSHGSDAGDFLMGYHLSEYLEVEDNDKAKGLAAEIGQLLHGIGIDDSRDAYILGNGRFKIGELEGSADPDYISTYIGVETRKLKNKELIKELEADLEDIGGKRQGLLKEVSALMEVKRALSTEKLGFPAVDLIQEAIDRIDALNWNVSHYQEKVESLKSKEFTLNKRVIGATSQAQNLLADRFQSFDRSVEGMDKAQVSIKKVNQLFNDLYVLKKESESRFDQKLFKEEVLSDLKYEQSKNEERYTDDKRELELVEADLKAYQNLIEAEENQDLLNEIQHMTAITKGYEPKNDAFIEKRVILKKDIENLQVNSEAESCKLKSEEAELNLRRRIAFETLVLSGHVKELGFEAALKSKLCYS